MKVLVVTPVHSGVDVLTEMTLQGMKIPEGARVDYFRARYGHDNTLPNGEIDTRGRVNLCNKYNVARDIVLQCGYDYMLTVEEDNIVPSDALIKLLECEADVAYGIYIFGREPFMPSVWIGVDESNGHGFPVSNFDQYYKDNWGKIIETDGIGLGCTLIKREVLERIPFRIEWDLHTDIMQVPHNDTTFAMDVVANGFISKAHLGCVVGHVKPFNEDKEPIKSIIFPVPNTNDGKSYIFSDYMEVIKQMRKGL